MIAGVAYRSAIRQESFLGIFRYRPSGGLPTRMRVALLSFDFGEYCIRLARGLARDAEVLLLLAHRARGPAPPPRLGPPPPSLTVDLVAKPRLRQAVRQIRTARSLVRRVEAFAPDVV